MEMEQHMGTILFNQFVVARFWIWLWPSMVICSKTKRAGKRSAGLRKIQHQKNEKKEKYFDVDVDVVNVNVRNRLKWKISVHSGLQIQCFSRFLFKVQCLANKLNSRDWCAFWGLHGPCGADLCSRSAAVFGFLLPDLQTAAVVLQYLCICISASISLMWHQLRATPDCLQLGFRVSAASTESRLDAGHNTDCI